MKRTLSAGCCTLALCLNSVALAGDEPLLIKRWHAAIENNDSQTLYALADDVTDINTTTPERHKSALMAAAGDALLVKRLLTLGADPLMRNNNHGTALMYACWGGDTATAAQLLTTRTTLNAQSSNGWTALMMCATKNRGRITRMLLDQNVDPNIADVYGWTPLMRAAYEGCLDALAVLLQAPAIDTAHENHQGQTALHLAAIGKRKAAYLMLLAHGMDGDKLDKLGNSPTSIARTQGLIH